jgi:hypothetical protein
MDIRNSYPDHLGLTTTDRNVNHTRWPCVSHPPELQCDQAVQLAGKRGLRSLPAQGKQVPPRDWVDHR